MKIEMFDEPEQDSPTVFEMMWDSGVTFFKCVGVFVFICFCLGYFTSSPAPERTCQRTTTDTIRSIFK